MAAECLKATTCFASETAEEFVKILVQRFRAAARDQQTNWLLKARKGRKLPPAFELEGEVQNIAT
jgi:hypothetical protein